jgi:NAD+ kinase
MKKIGFISNSARDDGLLFTKELFEFVQENGCSPSFVKERDEEFAFVVVLGGDGTMLTAAKKTCSPLLGINLGKVGFLTDTDKSGAKVSIKKAIDMQFKTETRLSLKTTSEFCALNEFVIKAKGSVICEINLKINGEYIDSFRGDGLIVCTPTGSTAYNLSAGGPILKPNSEIIAITPLCAHYLYSRPLVVSGSDMIETETILGETELFADGVPCDVSDPKSTKIQRGKDVNIIKTNGLGFYDILRKKFINQH